MENPSNSFDPKELSKDWFETKKFLEDTKPTGYLTLDNNFNEHIRAVLNYRVYQPYCESGTTIPTDPETGGTGTGGNGNGNDGNDNDGGSNDGGSNDDRRLIALWSTSNPLYIRSTTEKEYFNSIGTYEEWFHGANIPIEPSTPSSSLKEILAHAYSIAAEIHTPPVFGENFNVSLVKTSGSLGFVINSDSVTPGQVTRLPNIPAKEDPAYPYTLLEYTRLYTPTGLAQDSNGNRFYQGMLLVKGHPEVRRYTNFGGSTVYQTILYEIDGVLKLGNLGHTDYRYVRTIREYRGLWAGRDANVVEHEYVIGEKNFAKFIDTNYDFDVIDRYLVDVDDSLAKLAVGTGVFEKASAVLNNVPTSRGNYKDVTGLHLCYTISYMYEVSRVDGSKFVYTDTYNFRIGYMPVEL